MGRLFAVAALLLSSLAFAAEGVNIDLRGGVPKQLLGSTLGLAWSLTVFFFLVAMLYEAFGAPRWSGVTTPAASSAPWSSSSCSSSTAASSARSSPSLRASPPASPRTRRTASSPRRRRRFSSSSSSMRGVKTDSPDYGEKAVGLTDALLATVGGHIFDSMMMMILLVAELAHWLFSTLGSIVAVFFYVVGPLAIVASIPKDSGLGGRWFRQFLTYALWPVVSGLILQLTLAIGIDGAQLDSLAGTAGSMAVSLILIGTALMVPKIASLIVGESAPDLASESFGTAKGAATSVARGALAVKTGGTSAAVGAAASAASTAVRR